MYSPPRARIPANIRYPYLVNTKFVRVSDISRYLHVQHVYFGLGITIPMVCIALIRGTIINNIYGGTYSYYVTRGLGVIPIQLVA
jgi:hypothetical protein